MKHCFKCNSFKALVGGALVMAGNGRRRFACESCLPKISNRLVLRYVAKPKDSHEGTASSMAEAA